jgi:hypothetical protein
MQNDSKSCRLKKKKRMEKSLLHLVQVQYNQMQKKSKKS